LCVDDALLCALGFGEYLLEVLVAALWWFPGGVSEGFVDLVHVESVEKGGVGFLVGGCGDGRHGVGGSLGFVSLVVYDADAGISRSIARHLSLTCEGAWNTRCSVCSRKCAVA
jgi:hypothetical protein